MGKINTGLNRLASLLLKVMIFVALYYPASTTTEGAKYHFYYPEFLLVNAVAVAFMIVYIITIVAQRRWNGENKFFCIKMFLLSVGYYIFYTLMQSAIQWKWHGWNAMVSFGFLFLLMCGVNKAWFKKHRIIEFTYLHIIISNIIGIIVYFMGNLSVYWYDFKLTLLKIDPTYYERRYNWIYVHKSQYALMLLLSLAFLIVHRKRVSNRLFFVFGVVILEASLYLSHVNTTIMASIIMLGAFVLDWLLSRSSAINIKLKIVAAIASILALAGVGVAIFGKIAEERRVVDLGGRLYIWRHTLEAIWQQPMGIGNQFTLFQMPITELGTFTVSNGHNIFLNECLRFSIPVGICFTLIILLIVIHSFRVNLSIATLGIWVAVFMAWMMDYAVLISGWTLMFFLIYCIFFINTGESHEKEF